MAVHRLTDALIIDILIFNISQRAVLPPPQNDARICIAQVCSRWRRLIVTTPEFWNNIAFYPVRFQNASNLLAIARMWIRRSKDTLLSLEFISNFRLPMEQPKFPSKGGSSCIQDMCYGAGGFDTYSCLIFPHRKRIQYLTCTIFSERTILAFLKLPRESFANIEYLNICLINNISGTHSSFTWKELSRHDVTVFKSLPKLRRISFQICNGLSPLQLNISWFRLTQLEMGDNPISPKLCVMILNETSNHIVECFFQIDHVRLKKKPAPRLSPVKKPFLERLRLRSINPSNDTRIFKCMHLPALRGLWVEMKDTKLKGWKMDIYNTFLKHCCSPHLAYLHFSEFPTISCKPLFKPSSNQTLAHLFDMAKRLHTLVLPTGVQLHLSTLEGMVTGNLLPLLTSLNLTVSSTCETFRLVDAVRRRNENAARVTCLPGTSSHVYPPKMLTTPLPIMKMFIYIVANSAMDEDHDYDELVKLCERCTRTHIQIIDISTLGVPTLRLNIKTY